MNFNIKGLELEFINIAIEQRSDELIYKLTKKIAEIFANPPFNNYLVNSKDSSIKLSPKDVFNTHQYLTYDELMSYTPTKDFYFLDKLEVSVEIWKKKLRIKDSDLTLIRCIHTKEIYGGLFSYQGTIETVFKKYEEWENPILYSGIDDKTQYRSYSNFISSLSHTFNRQIQNDTKIFVPNLLFLAPTIRSSFRISAALISEFITHLPNDDMPVIIDCYQGSIAHKLFNSFETRKFNYPFDIHDSQRQFIAIDSVQAIKKRNLIPNHILSDLQYNLKNNDTH